MREPLLSRGRMMEAYARRVDVHPYDPAFPGVHVASMIEAPDGDLLYAFYGGPAAGEPDVATYLARLPAGSTTWQAPRVIFDEPGRPDGNAVLWVDGPVTYLFFATIMGTGWEDCPLRLIRSEDGGRTWSEPRFIRREWGWLVGSAPVRMSNGEVLVPIYDERTWRCGFCVTGGDYESWKAFPVRHDAWPTSPGGAIQPTTVELDPGHLFTLMRTRDGLIYSTESRDFGRTWSPARATDLPNPNARVALLATTAGALVLAYNPLSKGRHRLSLALSEDEGRTWSGPVDVEHEAGAEFSYPYLIQGSDSLLHLAYTHRRSTMRHLTCTLEYVRTGEPLPSAAEYGLTEYRDGELHYRALGGSPIR